MDYAAYRCNACNETFVVLYGLCRVQCTNCGKYLLINTCKGHCPLALECLALPTATLLFTSESKSEIYRRLGGGN